MRQIRFHTRRQVHGVTLAECLAAVALVAILAEVAVPSLHALVLARRLDAAAAQLAADIQFARARALARHEPVRLSLPPGAACWVVHTGDAALSCTPPGALKTGRLEASERVVLSASASSLLFDPVLGTSTPTATLRFADPLGREVRHVVNVLGRTRSCATDRSLPAYRPC